MNNFIFRIIACFIPKRTARHAFRERHCPTSKKETKSLPSSLEIKRLEQKIDFLTHAFLLRNTAPDAFRSLVVPLELDADTSFRLTNQPYANTWTNGLIKKKSISLQVRLIKDLIYLLPEQQIAQEVFRLLDLANDLETRTELIDLLSWIFRRAENYNATIDVLDREFSWNSPLSTPPPYLWRRFILSNLRTGAVKRAQELMLKYHKLYGVSELWRNYDLASLSSLCGKSDCKIDLIVNLGRRIEKKSSSQYWKEFLQNKKLAIVGNGPQERGLGKGKIIDQYDIVIRFNDFVITEKTKDDYGEKTDLWVCSWWTSLSTWKKDLPLVACDFFYADEFPAETLAVNLSKEHQRLVLSIPLSFFQKMKKESSIKFPTTGAVLLAWIKSLCPNFSSDDVFGFSFKAKTPPPRLEHYYHSDATKNGTVHNLDEERVYLRRLFGMEGA